MLNLPLIYVFILIYWRNIWCCLQSTSKHHHPRCPGYLSAPVTDIVGVSTQCKPGRYFFFSWLHNGMVLWHFYFWQDNHSLCIVQIHGLFSFYEKVNDHFRPLPKKNPDTIYLPLVTSFLHVESVDDWIRFNVDKQCEFVIKTISQFQWTTCIPVYFYNRCMLWAGLSQLVMGECSCSVHDQYRIMSHSCVDTPEQKNLGTQRVWFKQLKKKKTVEQKKIEPDWECDWNCMYIQNYTPFFFLFFLNEWNVVQVLKSWVGKLIQRSFLKNQLDITYIQQKRIQPMKTISKF